MKILEILKAIFLGIVEGITEWLPVSSTGHMILFDEFIKLEVSEAFKELFFVVIQLGAILAVLVLFFDKLNPISKSKSAEEKRSTLRLWGKVLVGAVPAAVIGFLFDDFLDEYLYRSEIIAVALIVYGIAFIAIEWARGKSGKEYRVTTVDEITYLDAIKIGTFQILSLVPGTSRSGSTILGGMICGVNRMASAEFSFFMAIPIMLGASGLKVLKYLFEGNIPSLPEICYLIIGMAVAFAVSMLVIKFLMDFVKKHTFAPFGVYRIILGVIVIIYFALKV